ncbi:MAG: hypothetical protein U1U88_001843 [Lawsonella clevelandensis]
METTARHQFFNVKVGATVPHSRGSSLPLPPRYPAPVVLHSHRRRAGRGIPAPPLPLPSGDTVTPLTPPSKGTDMKLHSLSTKIVTAVATVALLAVPLATTPLATAAPAAAVQKGATKGWDKFTGVPPLPASRWKVATTTATGCATSTANPRKTPRRSTR